jgi:hypothetical protein
MVVVEVISGYARVARAVLVDSRPGIAMGVVAVEEVAETTPQTEPEIAEKFRPLPLRLPADILLY